MKKRKIWIICFLFLASFLILWFCQKNPAFTEHVFSRGIYKWYAIITGHITGWIPFSLMELGILCMPVIFLGAIIILICQLMKQKKEWRKTLYNWISGFLMMIGIVFSWLIVTCTINYSRYTFGEISGLEIQPTSSQELYEVCIQLAEQANQLRRKIPFTDEAGVMILSNDSVRMLSLRAQAAYQKLNEIYPVFDYKAPPSKPVFFSRFMSYTDLVGVYCPFTMETNINIDVADYSIPSTICHEMAHYYGFMREDEANFISYLVCMQSESIEFQYSGVIMALIHAGNQLARVDMELYSALIQSYEKGVLLDLRDNSNYWNELKDNKIKEVSIQVNDAYLKLNHQEDGVKSYGRMVDLLLALYRQQKESVVK